MISFAVGLLVRCRLARFHPSRRGNDRCMDESQNVAGTRLTCTNADCELQINTPRPQGSTYTCACGHAFEPSGSHLGVQVVNPAATSENDIRYPSREGPASACFADSPWPRVPCVAASLPALPVACDPAGRLASDRSRQSA